MVSCYSRGLILCYGLRYYVISFDDKVFVVVKYLKIELCFFNREELIDIKYYIYVYNSYILNDKI